MKILNFIFKLNLYPSIMPIFIMNTIFIRLEFKKKILQKKDAACIIIAFNFFTD